MGGRASLSLKQAGRGGRQGDMSPHRLHEQNQFLLRLPILLWGGCQGLEPQEWRCILHRKILTAAWSPHYMLLFGTCLRNFPWVGWTWHFVHRKSTYLYAYLPHLLFLLCLLCLSFNKKGGWKETLKAWEACTSLPCLATGRRRKGMALGCCLKRTKTHLCPPLQKNHSGECL